LIFEPAGQCRASPALKSPLTHADPTPLSASLPPRHPDPRHSHRQRKPPRSRDPPGLRYACPLSRVSINGFMRVPNTPPRSRRFAGSRPLRNVVSALEGSASTSTALSRHARRPSLPVSNVARTGRSADGAQRSISPFPPGGSPRG